MRRLAIAMIPVTLAGCSAIFGDELYGPESSVMDASHPDGSVGADGSQSDAASFDARTEPLDSGEVDTGTLADAGILIDAGVDARTPAGATLSARPASVVECGAGRLTVDDHARTDLYGVTADDVRVASCNPDACSTAGSSTLGVDLRFDLGLASDAIVTAASLRISGYPNEGSGPVTIEVFDAHSDARLGGCMLSPGVWDECTAILDPTRVDPANTLLYTRQSDPPCYVVLDFVELTVSY